MTHQIIKGDNGLNDIDPCPRCGKGHKGLVVTDFTKPVVDPFPADPDDAIVFNAWTRCPETAEPILVSDPAKRVTYVVMNKPRLQETVAYALWEMEGCPHGRHEIHWKLAEWLIGTPPAYKIKTWKLMVTELKVAREELQQHLDQQVLAQIKAVDLGEHGRNAVRAIGDYIHSRVEREVASKILDVTEGDHAL